MGNSSENKMKFRSFGRIIIKAEIIMKVQCT